jgi:putative integral membrane protein (TIGR02587 family)
MATGRSDEDRRFLIGLARAFGGAIFFSMPLLMTMEMWQLGFSMDRVRLALFLAVFAPILMALCHFAGFQQTDSWVEDAVDGFVAYFVGFVTAAAVLLLLGLVEGGAPVREVVGIVALEAVPASVGAALAQGQLGRVDEDTRRKQRGTGYPGTLFLMLAGAIFFAFNVAPTEEMVLIAFEMSLWQSVALVVASLLMMHAFVYSVEFRGQITAPPDAPGWSVFLRYTVAGYALALLVSLYVLWTFGRLDGAGPGYAVQAMVVLGFPASLGAAAARLIF